MNLDRINKINLSKINFPCFIVDELALEKNAQVLDTVQKKTGCKILLALKAYALWKTFPIINKYLHGVCASGLNEARLGKEEFKKEVHTFSPAFTENEFQEILKYSDHIVFNSFTQWQKFKVTKIKKHVKFGLRVNPEKSVAGEKFGVYDPSAKNSRLGLKASELKGKSLEGISGLHFHALCEQNVDALEKVLEAFDKKFSRFIKEVEWINFGGGHHITREDYNIDRLCQLINRFKDKYKNIKEVYLEPGEAVALNTGVFITTIVDIITREKNIALIDSSVETHFPDILITRNEPEPYVPEIAGATKIKTKHTSYQYIIGGLSCAAGDVFGEYFFPGPLNIGDKLIFLDAAHYSMVKTNTFNGVNLPAIMVLHKNNSLKVIKKFGYKDYKTRLS